MQSSVGACNLIAIRVQLESVYCRGIRAEQTRNALIPQLVTIISRFDLQAGQERVAFSLSCVRSRPLHDAPLSRDLSSQSLHFQFIIIIVVVNINNYDYYY